MERKNLVIGIGNPNMGDDAIGLEIVNQINRLKLNIDTQILFYISFEILDKILQYQKVILVDAAHLGWEYGTWSFLRYDEIPFNKYIKNSHGITISEILKIGYQLFNDEMPETLYILAIETGEITNFKRGINKKLASSIPYIIHQLTTIFKEKNK